MLGVASLVALVSVASATVLPVRPERRVADADFVGKQKQVLNLFAGVGHVQFKDDANANWDISANFGNFVDEKYPKKFLEVYKRGMLPQDEVFSMACHKTMHETIKLFDLFYFAKDFDTFYKAACWARAHVNPAQFAYAYSMALLHRPDTQNFAMPPVYEVFPNFFVPTETMHKIYDHYMSGHKEGRFNYNNTNYEYNYHMGMFGGVLDSDNRGYGDYRISYFREDVGLNSWLAYWMARNPSWMCPDKYGKVRFQRRGENFYYAMQQLFARYTLERVAYDLPFTTTLAWDRPIKTGYNPRLSYFNGKSMYVRPDNMVPKEFSPMKVLVAKQMERRIWDAIDAGMIWDLDNKTFIVLNEENGAELIGRAIYGTTDRPSRSYYKPVYYTGLDALAYMVSTGTDRSLVGNAMSTPMTAIRDPAFFNYLARILLPFQHWKRSLGPYKHDELIFPGVKVENVEVDKLLTYHDMFDFEVTNGVPMKDGKDYIDHRYIARQYRLNHKPYRFNVTVKSEVAGDAIVRVFIGPKYDSDYHEMTHQQQRMAFFEIDRFPVKVTSGVNVWERSSTDSPIFMHDQDGFRTLYQSVNNAAAQKEQFYVYEGGQCGMPSRLQLPMGWEEGRPYVLSVVVSSFDKSKAGHNKAADIACGSSKLYDGRAMGFPFDRHMIAHQLEEVPNIFFKDVLIYYKEASFVNRPAA